MYEVPRHSRKCVQCEVTGPEDGEVIHMDRAVNGAVDGVNVEGATENTFDAKHRSELRCSGKRR